MSPEDWPAGLKILDSRQYISNADDVCHAAAGLVESIGYIPHTLLSLFDDVVRDRHRAIVEAGGSGDEYQIAVYNGP